ncbi:MAG: Holliday junction branch migration protein RuvA [Candidatus Peribacteraceae bacterium]|jgi:Holliday junction DNA helicase RuvA
MIAHLRGTIHKLGIGEVIVDVGGVGYRVAVPTGVWDALEETRHAMLWTSSYIREDRFDLFGFSDRQGQILFEEFLKLDGVGPKLALELCSVPRSLLLRAAHEQDASTLQSIKGVGRRTAEKLLVELKALLERHPDILGTSSPEDVPHEFDRDAIAALAALGYESSVVIAALRALPADIKSTEGRVAAALRSL